MTVIDPNVAGRPGELDAPGFRAVLSSEWLKLRTARVIVRRLLLAVVLGVVAGGLLSLLVGATFDEWSAADQADFDPLLYPMAGSLLSILLLASASVAFVSREHSTGMFAATFVATPRRGRVLVAKAIVMGAAAAIAGAVAMVGMFAVGQVAFAATDLQTATLDADALLVLVLLVPASAVFPVLAVFVATVIRSSASATTLVVLVILGPDLFGALFPDWWRRNVLSLFPGPAVDSVALSHVNDSIYYLHPAVALLVVVGWVVGLGALARAVQERRDA